MNYNKLVVNLLTATLILGAVVGCKKGPQRPTPIPGIGSSGVTDDKTGPIMPPSNPLPGDRNVTPSVPKDDVTSQGYKLDPNGPKTDWISDNGETFKSQIVYFEFDKSSIRSSEKPKVEEVARRMKSEFTGKALRIEGHCDERGTEEYNRALGERRALAVREMLIGLGIAPNMVETISYGEDKPALPEHNEAAWSKNRRGVFDLLTPPTTAANKVN